MFTLSSIYISETSGPIAIKFYLKHHWGGGKAALDFGADQYRTLVIPPVYEVYRGYIVFAFSVLMFVCLSANFFFRQRFLSYYLT